MSFDHYINSGGRKLRLGYTTGTCAALAAMGAAELCLTGRKPGFLSLLVPKGLEVTVRPDDMGVCPDGRCFCAVRKDGGDDKDATSGLLVYAYASVRPGRGSGRVCIDGGKGIGRVTKPGLDQPVGAAAINSVPRQMITRCVRRIMEEQGSSADMDILIEAPDGVTPFLNGTAVGQEKIVDPAVALTQLSELEQRFDAPGPRMVRYEVGPLYGQIAVSDPDGNEIAPVGEPEDGVLRYVIMPSTTYSFRVEAPEGVTVSVCGAELGEEQVRSREQTMFRGLSDYLPEGGYDTLRYEADGLYIEPQIRASYNGVELSPVIGGDGRYIYFYPDDDDISIAMHQAVEGFFDAYMYYTSDKYNGVSLKDVTDRILPDTELYSYFSHSYDAMIWASATEMDQKELRFDNFHRVGDKCFTCTILYKADFTATQWYGKDSYAREDGYKMVFIRGEEGQWLAATMSAFE